MHCHLDCASVVAAVSAALICRRKLANIAAPLFSQLTAPLANIARCNSSTNVSQQSSESSVAAPLSSFSQTVGQHWGHPLPLQRQRERARAFLLAKLVGICPFGWYNSLATRHLLKPVSSHTSCAFIMHGIVWHATSSCCFAAWCFVCQVLEVARSLSLRRTADCELGSVPAKVSKKASLFGPDCDQFSVCCLLFSFCFCLWLAR